MIQGNIKSKTFVGKSDSDRMGIKLFTMGINYPTRIL